MKSEKASVGLVGVLVGVHYLGLRCTQHQGNICWSSCAGAINIWHLMSGSKITGKLTVKLVFLVHERGKKKRKKNPISKYVSMFQ